MSSSAKDRIAKAADLAAQLGLGPDAGLIYAHLLAHGPCSMNQLASLPLTGEVTPALKRLLHGPLVGRDRDKRRVLYYATEPTLALLSFIAPLTWSQGDELRPLEELRDTGNLTVDQFRRRTLELQKVARRIYTPQDPLRQHTFTRADSATGLAKLTCEAIIQARTRIQTTSKAPRLPHVNLFWSALTDRMKAGVTYKRVVDLGEIVNHGLQIVERDVREYGVDLRVLESSAIQEAFMVVDSRYLIVQDTRAAEETARDVLLTGSITTNRHVIRRYRDRFGRIYESAVPALAVVAALREAGEELIVRAQRELGVTGGAWMRYLVDWGKFSLFARNEQVPPDVMAQLSRQAERANLVTAGDGGKPVPLYPLGDEIVARIRDSHAEGRRT